MEADTMWGVFTFLGIILIAIILGFIGSFCRKYFSYGMGRGISRQNRDLYYDEIKKEFDDNKGMFD